MLDVISRKILDGRYTNGSEQPEDIFKRVADYYGTNESHSKRLLSYFLKSWAMPASPILANGGTDRALPISCYLTYVPDSREGLADHYEEVLWMGTSGGGIGTHWSDVRSAGQKTSRNTVSTGVIQFMHVDDSLSISCSQGSVRQASIASFLDIDHPEILEFISMRKPSGGDIHRKNLNLHHGVNITDAFMEAVIADEEWHLIDPHSKEITDTIQARELWQQVLEARLLTGEPYICFIDEINRHLHQDLKDQGLKVHGSNLCVEITLPTSEERTAVCCLSSVNLEHYDEWKDVPGFVEDMIEFLDNVLEDFIEKAPPSLHKAVYSAIQERSIGLGAMGFHAYLQKNMIPFESVAAIGVNKQMFSYIKECAIRANKQLACRRGPAKGLKEDRFAHLLAIAPNASISLIAGTSPSIEPWSSNIFVQKTISGALTIKNKYLDKLLREKTDDVDALWQSILENGGSVQHLSILDDWEKDVFKTSAEIDQRALVRLAGDRQEYICQSQSLNIFVPSGVDLSYFNQIHLEAWRKKLKTLYYVRSTPVRNGRMVTFDTSKDCVSCEG